LFVAEGEKVVRRLLESPNFSLISVLMPSKWLEALRPLLVDRPEQINAFVAEKPVLEKITGYSLYQGVLALGKIPRLPTLHEILAQTASPRVLVAIDGLNNAENVGVIVRSCTALGAVGLIVSETASSPYLRRAVRSSMGAIFRLDVVETTSLLQTLGELQKCGIRCIAAHPHAAEPIFTSPAMSGDVCLVFGHESDGVRPEILQACDQSVAIPMIAGLDSLNVGSAAAIFLYETQRRRAAAGAA
jgi:tRNA G18 (ribose-2'-O)-methylase SpoU